LGLVTTSPLLKEFPLMKTNPSSLDVCAERIINKGINNKN
jgi:hypothetical protein